MPETREQLADAPDPEGAAAEAHGPVPSRVRRLSAALVAVGLWGTIAPYVGPEVAVSATVEFIDHVVPGVIILAAAITFIPHGAFGTVGASAALLAALWMTVTHVPLISQAARGETPWDGAIWMFVPSASLLQVILFLHRGHATIRA